MLDILFGSILRSEESKRGVNVDLSNPWERLCLHKKHYLFVILFGVLLGVSGQFKENNHDSMGRVSGIANIDLFFTILVGFLIDGLFGIMVVFIIGFILHLAFRINTPLIQKLRS